MHGRFVVTSAPSRPTVRTMTVLRVTAILVLAAILTASCGGIGREDVELVPPAATDDGGARSCVPPGASRVCQELGGACVVDAECCSSRCAGGVCLQAGSCAGPGTACTDRSSCCSGRCEPLGGSTNRVCLAYCKPDGESCTQALDCCSMGCHGGKCGGPVCRGGDDVSCTSDADCCSGHCSKDDHTCQADGTTVCRASGGSCGDGSDGGNDGKCCGLCDRTTQRCDPGPGPCRATGSICTQDGDCCRGTCASGGGTVRVCTAACIPDGTSCTTGADCCSHHCNGSPGTCGAQVAACKLIGTACRGSDECCSGLCLGGACGNNCQVH